MKNMKMRAKLDILYVENLHDGDSESNLVSVNIHRWSSSLGYHDTVMETIVIVDGETVVQSSKVLSYDTAAGYQRHGMKVFDEMLVAHPVLAQLFSNRAQNATL